MGVVDDYHEFRKLTKIYVETFLELYSEELTKGRWIFECYKSMAIFHGTFPTSDQRREVLEGLSEVKRSIDEDMKASRRFLDGFVGESDLG